MKGGNQPADAAARARLATYAPGAVVFMGPDGAFNATEGRCVEFKRVAPPRGGRHVVVRFDWPFLERSPDGSLRELSTEIDYLTVHEGLHTHITSRRRHGVRRELHPPAHDAHVHHLFAVGLPLPSCPIAPRDGQRVFRGGAIVSYGLADTPSRILIDVWGSRLATALEAWRSSSGPPSPLPGAHRARGMHGDTIHVLDGLAFIAWEVPLQENEDPRPILVPVPCPRH